MKKEIYRKVRNYLDENGIKRNYIAQSLNISEVTLSQTLNGKRRMTADELYKICKILNVEPNFFMEQQQG